MKNTVQLQKHVLTFGIPFLLILSMVFLAQSSWFLKYPDALAIGIILDLVLTIPLVYYFLIRKKDIPKTTVISLFGFGILVASFIIPKEQQAVLSIAKKIIFPVLELGVLSFLFLKARKTYLEYNKVKNSKDDFYAAIQVACNDVFPKRVAALIATEAAMIYYLFFDWKKKELQNNEFTNYKESGVISILLGIVLVILIETFAIHALLSKWSVVSAWILTFLSVYAILQFVSLTKSLTKRPLFIDVENKSVILRYGFFSEAIIPFHLIERAEVSSKDLPEHKKVIRFSPLGELESHNVILHLKEESKFVALYGFTKKYKSLAFFVDEKHQFVKSIEEIKEVDTFEN